MKDVVLLDTSIFCELLKVPTKHDPTDRNGIVRTFRDGHRDGWVYLLPLATVIETGNHIGQVRDGTLRRACAERFVDAIEHALNDRAPWSLAAPIDRDGLQTLLTRFTEWATREEAGLGDLTIVGEWERQQRLHPHRRVRIWSLDKHLQARDSHY